MGVVLVEFNHDVVTNQSAVVVSWVVVVVTGAGVVGTS